MDRLYHETNAKLHHIHFELGRLERCLDENEAQSIMQTMHAQLRELESSCSRLDDYVSREPPNRRQAARMRVDQLKADANNVQLAATNVHAKMTSKWRAASERDELLKQRFRPNESTALSMGDHELQLNDRLQSSHNGVDQLLSQGTAVLESLRSQHMNIRGVRRKILDIGGALGLSNTTLQIIDRRVREDWVLFLIGCVICCVFMYAFYRFWRG